MNTVRLAGMVGVVTGLMVAGCAGPSIAVSPSSEIYLADRDTVRVCMEKTTSEGQKLECRTLKIPAK